MSDPTEKVDPNAPVTLLQTPVRLDYTVVAGKHLTSYLKGFEQKKFIGARCDECQKVYLPSRGSCPTCGVPTGEQVAVADAGTVTTFCIINIPFGNMPFKPPYAAAAILLDGADLPIFHLIRGIPVDEVRTGMRVQAIWADELRPTLASVRWFEPTGEPDADYASYSEHI